MRPRKQRAVKPRVENISDESEFMFDDIGNDQEPETEQETSLEAIIKSVSEGSRKRIEAKKLKKKYAAKAAGDNYITRGKRSDADNADPRFSYFVDAFNKGGEDRLRNHYYLPPRRLDVTSHKTINSVKGILSQIGASDEKCAEFFYFINYEWHLIMSKYFSWANKETRMGEPSLSFVSNNIEAFLGVFNVTMDIEQGIGTCRVDVLQGVDLELIIKHQNAQTVNKAVNEVHVNGSNMTEEQQDMYVKMVLSNITAYEPLCPYMRKLSPERKKQVAIAWRNYYVKLNLRKGETFKEMVYKDPKELNNLMSEATRAARRQFRNMTKLKAEREARRKASWPKRNNM